MNQCPYCTSKPLVKKGLSFTKRQEFRCDRCDLRVTAPGEQSNIPPELAAVLKEVSSLETTSERLEEITDEAWELFDQSIELRLAFAKHPHTTPERLAMLAECNELELNEAIAVHPETPFDTLLWLLRRCPSEVFQNPSFERKASESPSVWDQFSDEEMAKLLCVSSPMEGIYYDASNRTIPAWFLRAIATSEHAYLVPHWKDVPEDLLLHFANSTDPFARLGVAENKNSSAEVLLQLLQHPDTEDEDPADHLSVYEFIAEHKNATPAVLLALAKKASTEFLLWKLLQHPNTNEEVLVEIAHSASPEKNDIPTTRLGLAKHPLTPKAILEQLAQDPDKIVRETALAKIFPPNRV